jgi:AcrR family transcriptional regulator
MMAERGYRAVTMEELATAVGLGKGALYHYIGSKEKVLIAIQSQVLEPLLNAIQPIAKLDARPLIRLRLTSRVLLTVMLGHLEHVRVYEHDLRALGAESRRMLVSQRAEFELHVRGLIEEAVRERSFRRLDSRLATLQFLNLHNHTYEWFDPSGPWDAEFLSKEYCRTFFSGVCSGSYDEADVERKVKVLWRTTSGLETSARGRSLEGAR